MKKIFYLLIISPLFSIGQLNFGNPQPIKVQVTKVPTFSESFNQGLQNGLAIRNARATEANAQSDAMKNNYERIEIDLLKSLTGKYKSIAIKKIIGWSGIENYETLINEIKNANNYQLVNELGKISDKRTLEKNKLFMPLILEGYQNDSSTLYLEWSREAITEYDRVSRLILKNYLGETVYQAEYKNKGYTEMLRPIITEYKMSPEEAKINLIKLKEYLDLGLITQSEFDFKAASLKKILFNF